MQGRLFVKEYRNFQLGSDPLPQSLRQMDTILHRRAAQRHEGHDIGCPHPRMDALVFPKIDEIGRHAKCAKGRFNDGVRFADKAQDGAMVIPIHRLVQQPDPWHRFHGMHQRTHRRLVSSLTEVRHTFDDSIHVLPHQESKQRSRRSDHPSGFSLSPESLSVRLLRLFYKRFIDSSRLRLFFFEPDHLMTGRVAPGRHVLLDAFVI